MTTEAMAFEQIELKVSAGIATVTLNRPERMNAWTNRMNCELTAAMRACEADDAVRVVVVTGAGRAFCAGADLSAGEGSFAGGRAGDTPRPAEPFWPYQVRKPVIAAINGAAIGVGITYPMLADIRLVSTQAKVSFAMVRRGVLPELASHITAAQVCGFSRAADLLLTGRTISGSEAHAMGLASEVLAPEQLLPRAMAMAADIVANTAPVSVALTKALLWEEVAARIPAMMQKEGRLLAWLGTQADVKEGVMSFLEKRTPEWQMRISTDYPDALLKG